MRIPVYRHPRADEHIYGWVQDLAVMNGMSFRRFADAYLGGMAWDGAVDSVSGMSCLEGTEDLRALVYNNTLLAAIAPYMDRARQAVSIDHLLAGGQKHVCHTATYMKVCPLCVNEDTARGIRPYYRVWHQLDEITRCAVHGVPLMRLKKRGPLDEAALMSAEPETGDCGDTADKVYSLYRDPAETDSSKWHCRMPKRERRVSRASRIRESELSWIREAEKTVLLAMVPCAACGRPYLSHPYTEGRCNICRTCRKTLGVEGMERAVMGIRKDYRIEDGAVIHLECGRKLIRCSPEAFIWSVRECGCTAKKGSLKIHKKAFDDGEFTVTEYVKDEKRGIRLLRVRHAVCGEEFVVRPSDFTGRRYCRVCREREYGRGFSERLRAMTGEEYELLTPEREITSAMSLVEMRHRRCGTAYANRARNILEGQRCPFCVSKPGSVRVAGLLGECFVLDPGCKAEPENGYVRITYSDGTSRRERPAVLVQEMTRLDAPCLVPGIRVKRLEPDAFFSPKAKLFMYCKEHCEDGVFRASAGMAEDLGITRDGYWSCISHLEKQGKIEKTGVRGMYRLTEGGAQDG